MATIFPTTVPAKRLSESITGSSTTFKLNNIEGWNGSDLTSADFGTKAYGVFRNSAGTLMELFEFDPATIASASITILLRGLKFTGDLTTEVSANKLTWVKGDTIVELGSHVPQLFKQMVTAIGDQTVAGKKTFSTIPASSDTPISDSDLATKEYVDENVNGGTVSHDQLIEAGNAGETVAAGNLLYFSEADNEWLKVDADDVDTLYFGKKFGIAQGAGTDGNAISGGVLTRGQDTNQSGMTAGDIMYASNTAGGLSASAGTNVRIMGIARSATDLYFDPDFAGYASEVQNNSHIYASDGGGDDTYSITVSPAIGSYAAGQMFHFRVATGNTGAATLAVSGLAAKTIKKNVNVDLENGDIQATQIVTVIYDGTNFQLLSRGPSKNPVVQVYTSNDTWTKPAGLKYVIAEVVGGGGGSGGSSSSTDASSAGGGGGGYSRKLIGAASLGATETVTIGAAGAAGTSTGAGGNGGNTTFGAHITGNGGTASAVGDTAEIVVGGAGGTGVGGDINIPGGSGGNAENSGTVSYSGYGGSSYLSNSTRGTGNTDGDRTGLAYGGGAGGSSNAGGGAQAGAAGAAGVCIVTEYY